MPRKFLRFLSEVKLRWFPPKLEIFNSTTKNPKTQDLFIPSGQDFCARAPFDLGALRISPCLQVCRASVLQTCGGFGPRQSITAGLQRLPPQVPSLDPLPCPWAHLTRCPALRLLAKMVVVQVVLLVPHAVLRPRARLARVLRLALPAPYRGLLEVPTGGPSSGCYRCFLRVLSPRSLGSPCQGACWWCLLVVPVLQKLSKIPTFLYLT